MPGQGRGPTVPVTQVEEAITQAHHEQWARVVATLTRRFGDLDIAEEAAAEAFAAFRVNRVLCRVTNARGSTPDGGAGTVDAIARAMKLGANHPMGPLELADFIGLDTCLSVMQVLYEGLADSKYRPCPLLVKYVEAGWLGRKTQRGFYDYRGDKPVPTR